MEYWLQCEDYSIKTLRNGYPYVLNKRTKFINKDSSIEKLFLVTLSSHQNTIEITNYELSSDTEIFFSVLKQFPLKYCSNERRKLLESFKKRELKLLRRQAQNLQHNYFQKRWLDLITDIALAKVCHFNKDWQNEFRIY